MHKISAILLVLAALSCKGKSQRSQSGFNDGGEVVDPKIFNEASREVASIEDASVDRTLIYTEGTGTPNCVTFSVTLKTKTTNQSKELLLNLQPSLKKRSLECLGNSTRIPL